MIRLYFTCALGLILALSASPVHANQWPLQGNPWLLVAVPQSSGKNGQILNVSAPFQVILTNATNHNLTVWKEWCSWGYFNLSFEFTDQNGKVIKVEKVSEVMWTKNSPDAFLVKPGCAYTVTVRLFGTNPSGQPEWAGVGNLHGKMTMRAVYKNTNEAFPGAKPNPPTRMPYSWQKLMNTAWVGQTKSKPIPVMIAR